MSRTAPISKKRQRRNLFYRILVYAKYCMPAISSILTLFFCSHKCVRFNSEGELLSLQSIDDMVSAGVDAIDKTQNGAMDEFTSALVSGMKWTTGAYYAAFAISIIVSLYLLIFALMVIHRDPFDPSTSRIKLWFRTFMPSKAIPFVAMLLPIYPTTVPYIIRYLYYRFYIMDIEVVMKVFNPLIPTSILVALSVVFWIAAIVPERRLKADPFARYDGLEEK